MLIEPKIPSILYLSKPVNLQEIQRSDVTPIILEMLIDCTFLALFARQVLNSQDSTDRKPVQHIFNAINNCRSVSIRCLSFFQFNAIEENLFRQMNDLITCILFDNKVERRIHSLDQFDLFFDASSFDKQKIDEVKQATRFVLAVANQIDYSADQITIPYIRVFNADDIFNKSFLTINTVFDSKRRMTDESYPSKLWYRIFSGIVIPSGDTDASKILEYLAFALNIGVVPSAQTDIGLGCLPFESYLASPAIRKLSKETSICFYNKQLILDALRERNAWLFQNDNGIIIPAIEADFSDSVGGDTDTGESQDPETTPDETQDNDALDDEPVGNEEDQPSEEEASDPTDDQLPTDTQVDDQPEEQTETIEPPKTNLLGFDIKLATEETADTFLYKLAVLQYIDDTLKFNHDDLPTETTALLKRWKSSFLFLTDAEETKKLFKKLKLRFQ